MSTKKCGPLRTPNGSITKKKKGLGRKLKKDTVVEKIDQNDTVPRNNAKSVDETTKSRKRKLKAKKQTGKMISADSDSLEAKASSSPQAELKYLRYFISDKYSSERQLFLKKNLANSSALLVANVPSFLGQELVRAFISHFVKIPIVECYAQHTSSVTGNLQNGQLTVNVVFESDHGVEQALEKCQALGPFRASNFVDVQLPKVLNSTINTYRSIFCDVDEMQNSIENFIAQHDQEVKEARREAKLKFSAPDEEGWITVTKASKKMGKVVRLNKNETPIVGTLKQKKNGIQKELDPSFYSQAKNDRINKAQEILEKFNEDKKKIALLKNSRKFNPY